MVLGRTYVVCSSGIFIIISGSGPSINDVTRITELLIAPYPHVIPFPICSTMRHRCFLKFLALKYGDIIYKRALPRTDGSLGHRHSAELRVEARQTKGMCARDRNQTIEPSEPEGPTK